MQQSLKTHLFSKHNGQLDFLFRFAQVEITAVGDGHAQLIEHAVRQLGHSRAGLVGDRPQLGGNLYQLAVCTIGVERQIGGAAGQVVHAEGHRGVGVHIADGCGIAPACNRTFAAVLCKLFLRKHISCRLIEIDLAVRKLGQVDKAVLQAEQLLFMIPRYQSTLQTGRVLQGYIVLSSALLVFMFCFNAVFLLMATSLNRNAKLQQENQFLSMQQQRYENLRTAIEEARQARHDMRHQFNQISALAEAGDLENLKSYLAKTVSRIPNLDMCFCENRAADSVVGYYCAMAKRDEIPFRARLDLPETLPVDEIDMCLVLSNLLENALEASLRTAPGRRKIEITACVHADRILLIEVENAFDGEINEKNGVFRSSKRRENGIGIQSVARIAEKTGGTSTFTHQNGTFSAKVMLCG